MIKIIHLITGLGQGGAENQLSQLVLHSDPQRFKHIVISMQDKGHFGKLLQEQGITLHTLNIRRGAISIKGICQLYKLLKQEKPHILQTWLYHADLLGTLVGKYLGFKNIVWNIRCSNMDLKHYSRLTALVVKFCAKLSFLPKAVIVNSKAGEKAHLALGYKARNWINIPNSFKTDYYRPDSKAGQEIRASLNISDDTLLIGMIARYDPMKDHFSFLQAGKKLLTKFDNLQFLLLGKDVELSNKKLLKQISLLGLEDHVHVLGAQNNIIPYLNALALLVLPSAFGEGFSNVLGEAMACGIPCVASDVGDAASIIGETGNIVRPKDPEALAAAITDILVLDNVERKRLGELARKRIIENYHFPNIIKQYERVYENLCVA